jgi:D-sedoheptulose 7-phosphate isomerase
VTDHILHGLNEAHETLSATMSDKQLLNNFQEATDILVKAFKENNRVYSCGNGGSMCDAMHFAEELTGRFRKDRAPLPAMAISDPGYISCVSNDFGYDHIFSRYIEGWGNKGDVLVAITSSGNSPNVIKAVELAKSKGIKSIALLGKGGGKLKDMVDIPIVVPFTKNTDRVQEIHIKLIHLFIEGVERKLFPQNY